MRDILLIAFLSCFLPMVFRFPYIGIYLWTWVAIMNPHRLVYSFARGQPFNQWIAIVTISMWLFSNEKKVPPLNAFSILTGLFALWICLTTLLSINHDASFPLWERNIKTFILMYLTMCLITSRLRLHTFLWVYVLSIGYWAAYGGLATIVTAGAAKITGPPDSMIGDNNHIALAIVIAIPIMNYLRLQSPYKIVQIGLIGLMAMAIVAIIGTYSRGGLIAMSAMAAYLWSVGRYKLRIAALILIVASIGLPFLPESYIERAGTIATAAEEDRSFQGRLDAWGVAWETAKDRPFGAGFDGPRQRSNWSKYNSNSPRAAHSIYFMVLGEHGFIGLILYLAFITFAWMSLSRCIKREKNESEPRQWVFDIAHAIKCSIFTFAIGGAALSKSYYDGFLLLTTCGALVMEIAVKEKRAIEGTSIQPTVRHFPRTPIMAAGS